jgi:multimeric flavodoxin WrbA
MAELYAAMRWCDVLILGSPVYMGMVSGQLKVMMDRCVVFRPSYQKALEMSGKLGGGIACGGFRNGGQETTLQNIHTFLMQQNLKVVNDGYPFSHAGATIVGEAQVDSLGLETIDHLVANLLKGLG